jgi:hypothetical protein
MEPVSYVIAAAVVVVVAVWIFRRLAKTRAKADVH